MRAISLVLLCLAPLVSCGDQTTTVLAPQAHVAETTEWLEEQRRIELLGRKLAVALSEPGLRAQLASAFGASPWDESQVRVQELFNTEGGQAIFRRMAGDSAELQQALREALAGLPPLALLVPLRDQRDRELRMSPIWIASALNTDVGPFTFYDESGMVRSASDVPAGVIVVSLAPEERRELKNVNTRHPSLVTKPAVSGGSVSQLSGTTMLEYFEYDFCDGDAGYAGDVELLLKISFYGEDGTLSGYSEFYDGDAPEPADCSAGHPNQILEPYVNVISHAIPDGGAHKIVVEVWEDDCDCFGNDDDHYATFTLTRNSNDVINAVVYKTDLVFFVSCGCFQYVDFHILWRFSWNSPPSSYVADGFVAPDPLNLEHPGGSNYLRAWFVDQYGYGILRNVDYWWSTDANVVSVQNTTHYSAVVEAHALGSENISFQRGSLARSAVVNVRPCAPELITC